MGETKAKTTKTKQKKQTAPKKPKLVKELEVKLKIHEPYVVSVPESVNEIKVINGDFGELVLHVYNSKQVLRPKESVVLKRVDSITLSSASMPTVKIIMYS